MCSNVMVQLCPRPLATARRTLAEGNIVAAPPQPAITVVLLKRQGRWCSHNETLWIRPGSYSMLSGSEIRTGHFVVLQIY